MRVLMIGNKYTDEYYVLKAPDRDNEHWDNVVLPKIYGAIQADYQFSGAWGVALTAVVGAVTNWLKGRVGGDAYREQAGWNRLIDRLTSMGLNSPDWRFVYCNHCDGKTYRVHITSDGTVDIRERERGTGVAAPGENPRFDCLVIKEVLPEIYKHLPSCALVDPKTGKVTVTGTFFDPSSKTMGIPNMIIYLVGGLLGVAVLFKVLKMIK